MSAFTVRAATPQDEARVGALLSVCYATLMAPDYDPALMKTILPMMSAANPALLACSTYYVAENDGGEIVGCGGWTPEHPGRGDIKTGLGHIRHFATHPAWTRRGVARALMARCKAEARAAGIDRLECYSSLSAEAFYAAQGFRVLGPIDIAFTPDCHLPCVHMACAL